MHPACGARSRQLAPQDRRKGEAHQIVQGAPGQVGVHQFHIDIAGVLHRLGDGGFGNGVEHHPLDLGALDDFLLLQHLQHVPGDSLALAVGVGGQDDAVGALGGVGDIAEALCGLGVHIPGHGEVFVGPYGAVLGRQIADMAVARQDRIVGPQVFIDGLGLGRTLDDDDVHLGSRGRWPGFRFGSRKVGCAPPPCQRGPNAHRPEAASSPVAGDCRVRPGPRRLPRRIRFARPGPIRSRRRGRVQRVRPPRGSVRRGKREPGR